MAERNVQKAQHTPGEADATFQDARGEASRREFAGVIGEEVGEDERRADAGAGIDDREPGALEEAHVSIQREVLKVIGPGMVGLQERRGREDEAPRHENAMHLRHGVIRVLEVLQHGLAVQARHGVVREREAIGGGGDVDAGLGDEVQIDEARMNARRTAADGDDRAGRAQECEEGGMGGVGAKIVTVQQAGRDGQ